MNIIWVILIVYLVLIVMYLSFSKKTYDIPKQEIPVKTIEDKAPVINYEAIIKGIFNEVMMRKPNQEELTGYIQKLKNGEMDENDIIRELGIKKEDEKIVKSGDKIAFSANGKFCSDDDRNTLPELKNILICDRNAALGWETFTIIAHKKQTGSVITNEDEVVFRSEKTGKYLTITDNTIIYTHASTITPSEHFRIHKIDLSIDNIIRNGDLFTFQSLKPGVIGWCVLRGDLVICNEGLWNTPYTIKKL